MQNKQPMPTAKPIASVHSCVHLCREAEIVRVKDGLNRLVCCDEGQKERYDLYLGDNLLLDGMIRGCPTCGARLNTGYGDGLMNEAQCRAAADRINQRFESLETAAARIAPLLGLMESGLYLIMDCELQPVLRSYYSEGCCLDRMFFDAEAKFTTGMCGENYDAPLYFMPTQRAEVLNPARIDEYIGMMQQENYAMPRAVALYLNGCVTLLLDGHHKAAAAAALGKRVRTLVICPIDDEHALEAALRAGKKLDLYHGRWNYEQDCWAERGDQMTLRDETGAKITGISSLQGGMLRRKIQKTPLASTIKCELPPENRMPWGEAPEICRAKIREYPNAKLLMYATMIPPDRVKTQMQRLMDMPWISSMDLLEIEMGYSREERSALRNNRYGQKKEFPSEEYRKLFRCLYAYANVFADSPMITQKQRAWLEEKRQYDRNF